MCTHSWRSFHENAICESAVIANVTATMVGSWVTQLA